MLTGSDHYAVLARIKTEMGWKFRGKAKGKSESRVCVEGLQEREKGEM